MITKIFMGQLKHLFGSIINPFILEKIIINVSPDFSKMLMQIYISIYLYVLYTH